MTTPACPAGLHEFTHEIERVDLIAHFEYEGPTTGGDVAELLPARATVSAVYVKGCASNLYDLLAVDVINDLESAAERHMRAEDDLTLEDRAADRWADRMAA